MARHTHHVSGPARSNASCIIRWRLSPLLRSRSYMRSYETEPVDPKRANKKANTNPQAMCRGSQLFHYCFDLLSDPFRACAMLSSQAHFWALLIYSHRFWAFRFVSHLCNSNLLGEEIQHPSTESGIYIRDHYMPSYCIYRHIL